MREDSDGQLLAVLSELLTATGIGTDEACALRWDDIDFTGATLRVEKRAVSGRSGVWVRPVRAKRIRRVGLDPHCVAALRELLAAAEAGFEDLPPGCGS